MVVCFIGLLCSSSIAIGRSLLPFHSSYCLSYKGEGGGGGGVRLVTKLVWISVINCSIHEGCVNTRSIHTLPATRVQGGGEVHHNRHNS